MSESQFQAEVVKLAKVFGWIWFHPYDSRRSTPGFPDLALVKDRLLFRELKTDKGKLTVYQKGVGKEIDRCWVRIGRFGVPR